jgi:hypothetical protein
MDLLVWGMLNAKAKACLLYCRDLLPVNLVFSLLAALLGGSAGFSFWGTFCSSLATGGAFLSAYFYERNRGYQYYFFYNLGIARWMLFASSMLVNILLAALVLLIKNSCQ